ncbi:MAG TPA: hypothetical protein IAA18_13835, partial [Candidatus Pseudomonas excrementavium]|nr:hypothetical protein [Candidatus Pseudomonas excrementavium]
MPRDLTARRQAWLALSMLGLGPAVRRELLDQHPDPTRILDADVLTLGSLGLALRTQNAIVQYQQGDSPVLERIEQSR